MRRRSGFLLASAFAAAMTLGAPAGAWLRHSVASGGLWAALKIGGGGFVDGSDIPAATGVKFQRTDAGGAYVWSAGQWRQLITKRAMPSTDFQDPTGSNGRGSGVDEVLGCNSDATCAYMWYAGYVFYSSTISTTDPAGIRWCRASGNLAQQINDSGNLFNTRWYSSRMAVDPHNKDHVIVGTTQNGLYETFNGSACGSAVWTQISSSSIPTGSTTGYRISFDPSSTMTCHSGSGACSAKEYVYSSGGTAVYRSTDAGATWSATTGGPASVGVMKASFASAGAGNIWATDGADGSLWRYTAAGTWAHFSSGNSATGLAIDPNNGDHLIAILGLNSYLVSANAAGATPTFIITGVNRVSGDADWALTSRLTRGATSGNIDFDPNASGVFLASGGQWVWTGNFATGGTLTVATQSNGIEELLLTAKAEVASAGYVTFGAQDQGGCVLNSSANLTGNPTDCGPMSDFGFLEFAYGLSQTPDRSLTFAKTGQDFAGSFDYSGTSTDGFRSNYMPLNLWNSGYFDHTHMSNNGSGLVRVAVPSTAGLTTWSNGSGSILCGISKDTLFNNPITDKCFAATIVNGTAIDLQGSSYYNNPDLSFDSTLLYKLAAPFQDWGGNLVVTNVDSHGALVRITTPARGQIIYGSQTPVCISGVTMTGSTHVNGCWIATNQTNQENATFDLAGSTFAGGDSYVSGGDATTWEAPGGSVAAASATNFVEVNGDNVYPHCTDDGGATYSQMAPVGGLTATKLTTVTVQANAGATSFTVLDGTKVAGTLNIILASGRTIPISAYSVAGNTVTLTNGLAVPPGDSIQSGAIVASSSTGFPFAAYFTTHLVDRDWVTPNTFYAVDADRGLIKWTHCNAPTLVTDVGGPNQGFLVWTFNGTLRTVPGEAGHLFYVSGPQGDGQEATGTGLWRTCNGTNSTANSVTTQQVPGFFAPQTVGFGHAAPGKNYSSIIVTGWYAADNVLADAVFGVWRSIDDASHGSTTACTNGSWQNLTPNGVYVDLPGGGASVRPFLDAIGDPFVYGPVYLATSQGAYYGSFP